MELEKANAHIQSLTLELEKVQRGKPGKRFNPTYEPSQVENGLMTNPGLAPAIFFHQYIFRANFEFGQSIGYC